MKLLTLLVLVFLLSACAPKQAVWNADLTSTTKQGVLNGISKAGYWSKEAKAATTVELQRAINATDKANDQADIRTQINEYIDMSWLPKIAAHKVAKKQVFRSTYKVSEQELRIVVSVGLSEDLQVAGVRALARLVNESDQKNSRLCFDEFDVIALTGISQTPEMRDGRDARLDKNGIKLLGLFDSLAANLSQLLEQYYLNWQAIEAPQMLPTRNLITHDNRLLLNAASIDLPSKVIAYKTFQFKRDQCESVRIVSYGQADHEILQQRAFSEYKSRQLRASMQKFKYEQEQRNQQIMFQRMRERALGK